MWVKLCWPKDINSPLNIFTDDLNKLDATAFEHTNIFCGNCNVGTIDKDEGELVLLKYGQI